MRVSIKELQRLLAELVIAGVSPDAEVGVSADPEGNEFWPLSADLATGRLAPSGTRFTATLNEEEVWRTGDMIFLWPGY